MIQLLLSEEAHLRLKLHRERFLNLWQGIIDTHNQNVKIYYAAVKDHLEPPLLKSSPPFTS